MSFIYVSFNSVWHNDIFPHELKRMKMRKTQLARMDPLTLPGLIGPTSRHWILIPNLFCLGPEVLCGPSKIPRLSSVQLDEDSVGEACIVYTSYSP